MEKLKKTCVLVAIRAVYCSIVLVLFMTIYLTILNRQFADGIEYINSFDISNSDYVLKLIILMILPFITVTIGEFCYDLFEKNVLKKYTVLFIEDKEDY